MRLIRTFQIDVIKLLKKAEKQLGGNFIVADLTYLETTNQTHLIEGV